MNREVDGNAVVYCEGAFNTTNGKTAHGLVRFTERYRVLSIVDSRYAGADAGEVLDGKPVGTPIVASIDEAVQSSQDSGTEATHLVVGLAPDGGRFSVRARNDIRRALELGLSVDSGLHDFLSDDPEFSELARSLALTIRDVRKPCDRSQLHFFTGRIEEVTSLKIALLGTDSAVGKRTTAWKLVHALRDAGYSAEMIGTGQTAWMQGARYGVIMDSLINDFVSGEIEHAVWRAWNEQRPDVLVIEGQGSLMNPAYPGGFEILAAGRPDVVVLQDAPARLEYDGFPGYPIHPLPKQIEAVEVLSGKPVVAVTINHEQLPFENVLQVCNSISNVLRLPVYDVLMQGAAGLVKSLEPHIFRSKIFVEKARSQPDPTNGLKSA